MISEKLCFKTVVDVPGTFPVFYSEESNKGYSIVTENIEQEDSKVNLEQLFNAVTENPEAIHSIFQS
jgi:ABC-2 type transport system ATP-binding protein